MVQGGFQIGFLAVCGNIRGNEFLDRDLPMIYRMDFE